MKVKELAEYLGVSPATVSLVLNNKPGISKKTRSRVLNAAKEHGVNTGNSYGELALTKIMFIVYRKSGASKLGVDYFSKIFSEVIEGIEKQCREKQCQFSISYIDAVSVDSEASRIMNLGVDGILLLATEMTMSQIARFAALDIPLVILDNYIKENNYDCVTINNELGVYQAISYLNKMGHTNIGYLHVANNANNFNERYFGFKKAFSLLDLHFNDKFFISVNTLGGDTLLSYIKDHLLTLDTMPSAFFADNDIAAITSIKALHELGYRVPRDVSIIGFDNMPLSEMMEPSLTTIGISKQRMGIEAVNRLVQKISDKYPGNTRTQIATEIVIRDSVRRF
ncbi:MAG: LacI family DNA-binding transcriptional regulator [Suipraeoptans sp.]